MAGQTMNQTGKRKPLTDLGIAEHSEINLRVRVTWFGPGVSSASETYLNDEPSGLNNALMKRLVRLAFGHLLRQYRPDE